MPRSYRELLLTGKAFIAIWGVGYIGYSNLVHLAGEGVTGLAYDPNQSRVEKVNCGLSPVPGLGDWLRTDARPLVKKGLMRASANIEAILGEEYAVHLVCVPTEREGRPWATPLRSVIDSLAKACAQAKLQHGRPRLVIIESTLVPGTVDHVVLPILDEHGLQPGRDILLGIAPRRDWFVDPTRTLRTVDRVFGGYTAQCANAVESVLSILCEKLHRASNHRVAELVKCVENAYRHAAITLANQLSVGFPDVDIPEVLDLASTKWNMQHYRPSFGAGGYCIPLAGQYLLEGATHPDNLTILQAAFEGDMRIRYEVAQSVIRRKRRSVGMLGLAYRGDIKVAVMSPSLRIAELLRDSGIAVRVDDPYYSEEEIRVLTGLECFDPVKDLDTFDTLIVHTNHRRYVQPDIIKAVLGVSRDLLVLDNYGIWCSLDWPSTTKYYRAGSRGWLGVQDGPPESLPLI